MRFSVAVFVFASCLLGKMAVMLFLCSKSSMYMSAVVMFYCELSLEEIVVLLFVFASCLWGRWW